MPDNKQPTNKKKMYRKSQYKLDGIPSSNRKKRCFQKRREQKRIKRTIFQIHDFIKFLLIIFLLWFASRIMICKYWYLPQNTFNTYPNKHIKIIGNKITPDDKILTALKTKAIPHKPIYLINVAPYEKEIEKLSPVRKAFVRRYWLPARFEVTVEEEIPVLTISPHPKAPDIAAITSDKHIISREYLPIDTKKYKTYRILTYDDYTTWTKQEIHSLEVLAQRIEDFSGEKLIYLDVRNKKDVYARIETIKIRIGELNTTLNERIERLSSVMPQIENLKRHTEYIDLRWDNTTYLKKKSKDYVDTDNYIPAQLEKQIKEQQVKDKKIETVQPQTNTQKPTENKKQQTTNQPQPQQAKIKKTSQKTQLTQKVQPKTTTQAKPQAKTTTTKPATTQAPKPQVVKPVSKPASAPVKKPMEDIPKINIQIVEP